MNTAYDRKYFLQCVVLLGAILLSLKLSGGALFGLVGLLLLVSAKGRSEHYLLCLMTASAMMMTNSWFVPKGMIFAMSQRVFVLVLTLIMTVQIAGRRQSKFLAPFLMLLAYLIYMFIPSFMGWNPTISLLKLLFFIMIFFGYYGVCNRAVQHTNTSLPRVRSVFLAFSAYFVLGSILLIPFPGISLMGADELLRSRMVVSLFKGMTIHSQSLGPAITIIAVILYADYIFSIRKKDKLYLLLLFCCPVLIYKTSSRTAMASLFLGILMVSFLFLNARGITTRWRSKVVGILGVLFVISLIVALSVGSVRQRVVQFALKFDADARSSDVSFENVTSTRQDAMQESLRNFKESPAIGNGFQVTRFYQGFKAQRFTQLLSAPIEKGVWVTAVLEEGGVFGMILFLWFIIYVLMKLYFLRAYIGCSAFFTMIVLNLGEFVIFSMTAVGGLIWFCVFVAALLDALRIKQEDALAGYMMGGQWGWIPQGHMSPPPRLAGRW